MTKVLVTGAAGRVGKELCARLKASGNFQIRACCRRPEREDFLKQIGVDEVVKFDYNDDSNWAEVVKDMNWLFSSSPDPALKGHKAFCSFLKDNSSIKQGVRLSCFGAEQNTACQTEDHVSNEGAKVPHMLEGQWHGEQQLIETGMQVTAVRGNFFMSHIIKTDADNIQNNGFFKTALGKTKNSFVSTNDLGEVAALCFIEGPEKHANKFQDITGPVPQSMYDVARDLSKVMKKEIKQIEYSKEDFVKDFGPTRWEFFEQLNNGFQTRVSPDFYNLTGRRPTTQIEHMTQKGKANETGLEELFQAGVWAKGKDIMAEANKK